MIDCLALRDNAKSQLMQIRDIETGVQYLKQLDLFKHWVKAEKKDRELQNLVSEQKIRTQRILGQLIKEMQAKNSLAKSGEKKRKNVVVGIDQKKHLSDIGITKDQSSNFQKIASIPTETFEQAIVKAKEAESNESFELTNASFVRFARQIDGTEAAPKDKQPSFNRKKLFELRYATGKSQHEFGLDTGVEGSAISRMENGAILWPSFDAVARCAEALGVQMEVFKMRENLI